MRLFTRILMTMTALMAAGSLMQGCKSLHGGAAAREPAVIVGSKERLEKPGERLEFIPSAIIYRTNGDYAEQVPVTLAADRSRVVSFPAPSDLGSTSTPLPLADGYLLDRRGIGPTTAFLRYTYDEYRALKRAPSTAELLKAVIPGAIVTEIVTLPMTMQQAAADTAAVNRMILDHSPELKVSYTAPRIKM